MMVGDGEVRVVPVKSRLVTSESQHRPPGEDSGMEVVKELRPSLLL